MCMGHIIAVTEAKKPVLNISLPFLRINNSVAHVMFL